MWARLGQTLGDLCRGRRDRVDGHGWLVRRRSRSTCGRGVRERVNTIIALVAGVTLCTITG